MRLFIPWPEPRSPSRRERRSGAGPKGRQPCGDLNQQTGKGPRGPQRIRQPAWTRCTAARSGATRLLPPPPGGSSAGLLLPGRYRSHRPAPGTAGLPAAPLPLAGRSLLLHRADQSRCAAAAGRHAPAGWIRWLCRRIPAAGTDPPLACRTERLKLKAWPW